MAVDSQSEMLEVVRSLTPHTVTTTLRNPRGSATRTFTGALLSDYARAAALTPAPPSIGFGNHYFVATAEDGFCATIAYFEVTPRATDKQVLLAYEQDGEPIRAGLRLVVPGDGLAGRSITGIASIELRRAAVEPSDARPVAETLSLGGLLRRPAILTPADLARFTHVEVTTLPTPRHGGATAEPQRYQGVRLWDLLEDAGPALDANVNEDILRKVVVARTTDGYASAIAAGELDPRFMGGEVIVATEREGEPLADDGRFRLVVPYDKAVARSLKNVHSVELLEA
jgi:DMSO/TMAO reductase YedYZ molybdopterin-dependent catalytic subunit